MKIGNVVLEWLGHAGFMIKAGRKTIYIDPFKVSGNVISKADLILITHGHYDHCSLEDIQKITKRDTVIVATADCQSKIARLPEEVELHVVEPNQENRFENFTICTVLSYNKNKQFHEKDANLVGYVIRADDTVIYHAGDTDMIKEMERLTGYGKDGNEFIALLPIGGTYTMDADEAVEAVKLIKPTFAIPMHYGSIVGDEEDARKFVSGCESLGINSAMLEKF